MNAPLRESLLRAERGLELADHLRLRPRDLAHPEHAAAGARDGLDALDQARAKRLDLLGGQVLVDALDHMEQRGEDPRLGPALQPALEKVVAGRARGDAGFRGAVEDGLLLLRVDRAV